jgi:hypothetical protein
MKYLLPLFIFFAPLFGDNQTDTVSPVLPNLDLPFGLTIETAPFTLPSGIQAYASGTFQGKWVFLSGRTNGLHGFGNVGNNFPPVYQNTTVYVIDPQTGSSWSRSLTDPSSGLTQTQIDDLSTTANQSCQKNGILYIVGGYGINTESGQMETKSVLSAIDLKELVQWVIDGGDLSPHALRQVSHPILQVTGGALYQNTDHDPFLLILGQNFIGLYEPSSNGLYTKQIRKFWLNDDGHSLFIFPDVSLITHEDYRRRDLNVLPIMRKNKPAYVAFAGVFTLSGGVWTVPITIFPDGSSFQPDPEDPQTFKQAMNQYNCAAFGLYSVKKQEMYAIFPGGISYGYFSGDTFQTDDEFPFINQVTTIKIDKHDQFTQIIMDGQYPEILSTGSNPGNPLLFGAEAQFFPKEGIPLFHNGVIQFDKIKGDLVLIGHIVGGIMSTLPNTNTESDSTASPYVFEVYLSKNLR